MIYRPVPMLIPVLAVEDVEAARLRFQRLFGFSAAGADRVAIGDQQVLLVQAGAAVPGLMPMRIDHVALSVSSADEAHSRHLAAGAALDPHFTPDGPRTIPEFWQNGARFVFFKGPEDWPLEFCEKIGAPDASATSGHDHYGVRTPDVAGTQAALVAMGATLIASHVLGAADAPVNVRFLALEGAVFELFDEPGEPPAAANGWVGIIRI